MFFPLAEGMYTHSTYWTGEFAYGMVPQLREAQSRLGFDEGTFQNMLMNIRWVRQWPRHAHAGARSNIHPRAALSKLRLRLLGTALPVVAAPAEVQLPTGPARCPAPAARATWCRTRSA